MSIAGNCKIHNTPNVQQDVGRGKWVPVCPQCDSEHKAAILEAFSKEPSMAVRCECGNTYTLHMYTVCPRCFSWNRTPYHAACGLYHAEGQCPVDRRVPKVHARTYVHQI